MIKKFLKNKKKIIFILILIIITVVGIFLYKGKAAKSAFKLTEYAAAKKTISVSVTGSGSITSSLRQNMTANQASKVKNVYFKVGDTVKAGDLILELDSDVNQSEVERVELSIKQAQDEVKENIENLSDLSVEAPVSGQITNITVKEGDSINKGTEIATITDKSNMILKVPFNKSQIDSFKVGDSATVYIQDFMQVVNGTVIYKSAGGRTVAGGGMLYDVKIRIENPGTLQEGIKASAQVGQEMCVDNGVLENQETKKIKAEVSGVVKRVNVNEYDNVSMNQVIIELENDDLQKQLENSQVKLEDLQLQLKSKKEDYENYIFYASQDGIIVSLDAKKDENVKSGQQLAVIADYSKMSFEISADELDIARISEGLEANVNIDALEGRRFKGKVSEISKVGTTQNGVTTYPVTIEVLNPKDVIEGMNATADIFVSRKENVLSLPINAVQRITRESYVFIKKNASNDKATETDTQNISPRIKTMMERLGKDIVLKKIVTGTNNDSDIEIVSGLNEGDKVIIPVSNTTTNANQSNMMFGAGGGQSMMGGVVRRDFGTGTTPTTTTRTGGGNNARN